MDAVEIWANDDEGDFEVIYFEAGVVKWESFRDRPDAVAFARQVHCQREFQRDKASSLDAAWCE